MHNAQNIVTVGHGVNYDPDCENVKYLVDVLVAHNSLAIDAVYALNPAADVDVRDGVLCAVKDL